MHRHAIGEQDEAETPAEGTAGFGVTSPWRLDIFNSPAREAGKTPALRFGLAARAPDIGPVPKKRGERRGASLLVAANVSSL